MKTIKIPISSSSSLELALKFLNEGELIAFPTDTVYGIGTFAFNAIGAAKIYRVKERPAEKALPILVAEIEDFEKVAIDIPDMASKLAKAFLPGALTLVLPKHPDIPNAVSALETVGIRIPKHDFTRALLRVTGPMAVTSANISGKKNPITAEEVYVQLVGRLPLILDGGASAGGIPSTVVDCTGEEVIILREGAISPKEIFGILAR